MKAPQIQWQNFKKKQPCVIHRHIKSIQHNLKKKCTKILREYLDEDETRMLRYHMASTTACVKIGDTYGEKLKINIGFPQGDCLSPILFTTYLFKTTEEM